MFCKNCGKQIDDKAVICVHCGVATENYQNSTQPQQPTINIVNANTNMNANLNRGYTYPQKSKWVAFFLCLFLGFFGAHRFYVGKGGTGILWLLTGGMFSIGWFIDTIVILCGGFRDKSGVPLK